MHIIIRGEVFLVLCQTSRLLSPSLLHQKLYGMSFLSAVSGSPWVYILEKPDELAISEQRQSQENLNNKHSPSHPLVNVYFTHFYGSAVQIQNVLKWIKKTWESPHYYYHYYCPEISPLAL